MGSEVRLYGDPFVGGESGESMRRFLREASAAGWSCAIDLTAARGDGPDAGNQVALDDGRSGRSVGTALGDVELDPIWRAVEAPVAVTAPIVAFGGLDAVTEAQLAYPEACVVLIGDAVLPDATLRQLDRFLAGWPSSGQRFASDPRELAGYRDVPIDSEGDRWLHPGSRDPSHGTDIAVLGAVRSGTALTVVLAEDDADLAPELIRLAEAESAGSHDVVCEVGPLRPSHFRQARGVLLPARQPLPAGILLVALASGRPVVVSRFGAMADVLDRPGICYPLGGRTGPEGFQPDDRALDAALAAVASDPAEARAVATRARAHVLSRHRSGVPAPRMALPRPSRPLVVLEAPLFEVSSASVLTIETARALVRRGRVDVHLVSRTPLVGDLQRFREFAGDVAGLLSAPPPRADLWLSAGWPPRPGRPDAEVFAVRVDWEYGALPTELTPLVTEEADLVVVHSNHVQRIVAAAGRPVRRIRRVPHGVDPEVFRTDIAPHPGILGFKGQRPAILFVGGLIWRKGFDLLLGALLRCADHPSRPVLVVKATGGGSCYAGYHLEDLLERVRRSPAAPDVMVLDQDVSSFEMARIYRACDLMVHPYRGEGFGMPVLEARAMGLPVLTTAGGSTDDFCDGAGCRTVPAERRPLDLPGVHMSQPWVLEPDADELRSALVEMLDDLPSWRAAAEAEVSRVVAGHDWERAAAELEQVATVARQRHLAPRRSSNA